MLCYIKYCEWNVGLTFTSEGSDHASFLFYPILFYYILHFLIVSYIYV